MKTYDELRKCTVKLWDVDTQSRIETPARFHQWMYSGADEYPVAIIELKNGEIECVNYPYIKFTDHEVRNEVI